MSELLLSVLIPTIPSRHAKLKQLYDYLLQQIEDGPVEVLCHLDNKHRTIGRKRNDLLQSAQGKYVVFVDDDDWVHEAFIESLLEAIAQEPDVIVYPVRCNIPHAGGSLTGVVESSVKFPNEQFVNGGTTKRKPIQIHCWKRKLAVCSQFPNTSRGEDFKWAEPLWDHVDSEIRINKELYVYDRERDISEAYDA